jgi:hypothetical protein
MTKLNELGVAAMVHVTSDRFGVPATAGDTTTASGMPLSDDPFDKEAAVKWTNDLISKSFIGCSRRRAISRRMRSHSL